MVTSVRSVVFDYRALRLLMGVIAFSLSPVVSFISTSPPSSISASYYTEARDAFIGMLFVVSAFLLAYNGHTFRQAIASKVAAVAAVGVALFPTSCDGCSADMSAAIHTVAAITLFSILAYFCLGPFREKTKRQTGKKKRRAVIYLVCGWVMVVAMVIGLIAKVALSDAVVEAQRIIYIVEAVALTAFGVGWIVAGKYLPVLVDDIEALRLFRP